MPSSRSTVTSVAEPFHAADPAANDSVATDMVEMLRADILVLGSISEHVVDSDQEGAGDSDGGPVSPPPRGRGRWRAPK